MKKEIESNFWFHVMTRDYLEKTLLDTLLEYDIFKQMKKIKQSPDFHPEGDALNHTFYSCLHSLKIASRDNLSKEDSFMLFMAALCHDLGKLTTTRFRKTKKHGFQWTSRGHDVQGVIIAEKFMKNENIPKQIIEKVLPTIRWHMWHIGFKKTQPSPKARKKLVKKLAPATVYDLNRLIDVDLGGRPPLNDSNIFTLFLPLFKEDDIRRQNERSTCYYR